MKWTRASNQRRINEMDGRMKQAGAVIIAALALNATSMASAAEFTGAGQTGELECDGGSASIVGADNELTITGDCQLLAIEGAGNRVHVAMAKNGVIRLTGASNEVHWSTPDGTKPKLQVTGAGNHIVRAAK